MSYREQEIAAFGERRVVLQARASPRYPEGL